MDNYIVSARKYRPSTFRSVVGQRSLTTTLKNAIQNNKLAHAYLFCGPRGVGKTSCARIFAKTINCLTPTADGEACNGCESCNAFNEQRSYNIHELDAASNNSVDDIRSLIEQVRIPPAIGKYKVFIIDEVHMLSPAAFNAFLKTLEEPPHHALFILATTEKHKVLPTILSRCQIYDFSRISIADMVEHLQYVATSEGATAEPEALNVIAQKADGGMRDALSILDQVVSFTNGTITYQAVIDNLNVLDYEYYFRLTEAILGGNVRSAIIILNEILSKGFDGQNIITGLASHFRDLLVCKDESTLVLFEVGASIKERYRTMAQQCTDPFLYKAIELANSCDLNYRVSRNKRLLLELTLIQLCQLTQPVEAAAKSPTIDPIQGNQQGAQQVPPPTPPAPVGNPVQQPQAGYQPQQAAAIPPGGRTITTQVPPSADRIPEGPPATPPKKVARIPRIGASLKEILSTKDEQVTGDGQQQAGPQQQMANPFAQDDLIREWNTFAGTLDKDMTYLKNIMINCKPVLKENHLFEISVYNPEQQDELGKHCIRMLTFLRTRLQNSFIQMRVRMTERDEKKLAVTATEKYSHLANVNPLLNKLKDEFNLMLD
ncbi:MAG: DNA polymerase III subunit gamma/tau [Tannerellaceae bacterium]|nr:DNA polymerase III subunit gamma/tau [Tannerellaceae bacterium]MCD8264086.1 DNA polymerase III subunit gamma/tau [Tannerellaceae bacterium]